LSSPEAPIPKATVNLKERGDLVEQYVALRNTCLDLLLTRSVTAEETRQWLEQDGVEVLGLTEGDRLFGAVVLYKDRDNEIAFFASDRGQGIGTELLRIIEEVASWQGLHTIWGWVLCRNLAAQKTFEKAGFSRTGESTKTYAGKVESGFEYRKHVVAKGPE